MHGQSHSEGYLSKTFKAAAAKQQGQQDRARAAKASGGSMGQIVMAAIGPGDPAVPATPKAPTTARRGGAKKMQYGGASSSKLNAALKSL